MRYVCSICGYVYDEARHQPRETLPNNWKCPPLRRGQGGFSARRHTVTRMLQSLLTRYTREDEAILALVNKNWTQGATKTTVQLKNLHTTTFLTILLGGKVIEGIGRALLVEEDHIIIDFLSDRLITGHV